VFRLDLITPPAAYPVDVSAAKVYARVSTDTENALIERWIRTATELVQERTDRQCLAATFELVLDSFADWSWLRRSQPDRIELRPAPLLAVESVKYLDVDGVERTLVADTDYYVSLPGGTPPRATCPAGAVCLMPDVSWPETQSGRRDSVRVRFTAGYGVAAAAVPDGLKDAILAAVAEQYDGRPRPELAAAIRPHIRDFVLKRVW
jgi:uncharacterized phiE125 gp8 family phage protein